LRKFVRDLAAADWQAWFNGAVQRTFQLHSEYVVIYHQDACTRMPLVGFSRQLLEMPAEARAKALIKVRQLEQSLLTPLENLRAPP